MPSRFAESLGMAFTDIELLRLALTHRSVAHELRMTAPELELPPSERSNERLEFLGDAVIGYIVAADLYQRFPEAPEGDLTARRVAPGPGRAAGGLGSVDQYGRLCLPRVR